MNNYPFVSVIVPIFNANRTIKACIESVFNQEYPRDRYEVVIVDDGSIDGGDKLIEGYPLNLVRQRHQGQAIARNVGFCKAKGEIVIFLDSDCIVERNWIGLHVREHILDKEAGCVGGSFSFPARGSNFFEICDYYTCWFEHHPRCPPSSKIEYVLSANLSFSREVFAEIGGFHSNLKTGEDLDICGRLKAQNRKVLFRPQIAVYHLGRQNLIGLLLHHFRWGRHGPIVRRFGSGKRGDFLFRPSIVWAISLALPMTVGLTAYIVARWLRFAPLRILSLLPMLFISKLAYAAGAIRGTLDVKKGGDYVF